MNILNDNGKYYFYNSLQIEKELVTRNYLFNFSEANGSCWLEDAKDFNYPEKIYDIDSVMRKMIKKSFDTNDKNLGVLLTGNKGQGKSLNAKLICKELNLPCVIINKPIPIEINFIQFLNNIDQNFVIFLDEFEKLFETTSKNNGAGKDLQFHTQESFLSFMDGVLCNKNKILFLLTTNENINDYFINRPSRIKFLKEYNELPEDLFNLITDDLLVDKKFKKDLEDNISLINLNIDLLISIIKEINLFKIPFSKFMEYFNYRVELYSYDVHKIKNGKETYEDCFKSAKKIKYTDHYICGYDVQKFIKFTKDEIIFQTFDYNDKDEKESFNMKITLTKNFKHVVF